MTDQPEPELMSAEQYSALPIMTIPIHTRQNNHLPRYLMVEMPSLSALGRKIDIPMARVVWIRDDNTLDDPAKDEDLQAEMEAEYRRRSNKS